MAYESNKVAVQIYLMSEVIYLTLPYYILQETRISAIQGYINISACIIMLLIK